MSGLGFISERADFSRQRIADFSQRLETEMNGIELSGLTIFTAGSYARLEASKYSDIDLFFIYDPSGPKEQRHTGEILTFARLINLVKDMGFPPFSNDSQYLQTHNTDDVLRYLGSRDDDARNYFTLRMLLLLESQPLYGRNHYESIIRRIIESYYVDFPKHETVFEPWFLINDIMRFWKTLLLNYENKRISAPPTGQSTRVRNFKLKFSRMTTCFATVAALGSMQNATQDDVFNLILLTPRERLNFAAEQLPEISPMVESVVEDYAWFLHLTGLPTEALHDEFSDRAKREAMFGRANSYGAKMFDLLAKIDGAQSGSLLRFLVI